MPVQQGASTRALMALTVGVIQSTRGRVARDLEMGLTELMQQFQVEISGVAGNAWGFATATIAFEFPFYYAPGQRDPDFDRPQFWFGAEVAPPVAVSCVVTQWSVEPSTEAVNGAAVAIGVCAATTGIAYNGIVHFTFQGFSALEEDQVDLGDVDVGDITP